MPKPWPALAVTALLALASGACAARSGVPTPVPFPGAALPPTPEEPESTAADPTAPPAAILEPPALVQTALGFRGVPYRWGGSDPSGFDCSGFVQYVFAQHGTLLPREVRDQYRAGRRVGLRDLRPGDLIFFETVTRGASHVGLVIDQGRFVHAPSSRGVVRVERYDAPYWASRFVGARRVTDSGGAPGESGARLPGAVRSSR